jgi:hypothetical protein
MVAPRVSVTTSPFYTAVSLVALCACARPPLDASALAASGRFEDACRAIRAFENERDGSAAITAGNKAIFDGVVRRLQVRLEILPIDRDAIRAALQVDRRKIDDENLLPVRYRVHVSGPDFEWTARIAVRYRGLLWQPATRDYELVPFVRSLFDPKLVPEAPSGPRIWMDRDWEELRRLRRACESTKARACEAVDLLAPARPTLGDNAAVVELRGDCDFRVAYSVPLLHGRGSESSPAALAAELNTAFAPGPVIAGARADLIPDGN